MSKKTAKTEFDEILSNGVDFKNRRIYFGLDEEDETPAGSFTWESVEVVIRALHKMESDYASKPIELHMSSYGGETDEMLRLYDAIQICTCQIKFYGSGKIMSAASWIMAGCDERYLTPNTQVMIHKWRGALGDATETDHKIEMNHAGGWLTDKLNQIYADNSRMPVAFWEEVTKRDLYLTPEETIQLGLADFIVPYAKRGNLRRKRMGLLKKKDSAGMKKLVNDINRRIERGKNLKIELHTPEEEFDKTVIIDDSELDVVEVSEPLIKETVSDSTDQLEPVCGSTTSERSKDDDSSQ